MNLIKIDDINMPELDVFARMSEAQLYRYCEPDTGIFLAESAEVILRALEAGYEPLSMLVETHRLEVEAGPVFAMIEELWGREKMDDIPVYIADSEIVTSITGYALVRGLWMTLRRKPAIP
ncbi:MAG: RNA methyltransferase, partial [Lachnospiraceae bacterium]|nr:RNA methyltransferase [Lachnospiraceae bacterium]